MKRKTKWFHGGKGCGYCAMRVVDGWLDFDTAASNARASSDKLWKWLADNLDWETANQMYRDDWKIVRVRIVPEIKND